MNTNGYKIILGSGSPRRQAFFEEMGFPFQKKVLPVEETFPSGLSGIEIAHHIVKQKATAFEKKIQANQLVITADTVVWHKNQSLGKPKDKEEAKHMLKTLSGSTHQVITAVGFLTLHSWESLHALSEVTFKKLSSEEIHEYVNTGSPMDKAGAYGIQDSFGTLSITEIRGSYSNIIGLPVPQVYEKMKQIINKVAPI